MPFILGMIISVVRRCNCSAAQRSSPDMLLKALTLRSKKVAKVSRLPTRLPKAKAAAATLPPGMGRFDNACSDI